ncbi:hypothetical protein [Melissococcus plutonius]|uniref:hypothetical protein n=1 Tax=Melissococcus plutonius TaxID=33970 RepID=UPI0021E57AC4|nr:hypothetical protein [Melissococcus plutonius]MCV2499664.1 hypothetical protein [Melissococcus plutonius]MCV2501952.1 hypothetical protein [Melissococcus plutonius]MCV2508277.1 hypothetical protein [Melissococcus plutonius]MCV2528122.1 hypothetical protein [Melissococcus plutonius]
MINNEQRAHDLAMAFAQSIITVEYQNHKEEFSSTMLDTFDETYDDALEYFRVKYRD